MQSSLSSLLLCGIAACATASTMSIVSMNDPTFCLDLLGERTQDATPIDVWKCTAGLLGQQWYFDAGTYKIRSAIDGTKCIDAGDGKAGTKLTLKACNDTSKSQFFGWDVSTNAIFMTPSKGEMAEGSMCLQASNVAKGQITALSPCGPKNVTKTQQWTAVVGPPPTPVSNATFTFSPGANATMCMGLDGNKTDNGSPVKMSPCQGSKSQEWIFAQGTYRIASALNPKKCIDAWTMKMGNKLMVWDCNGFAQQQWGYEQTTGKSTGHIYLTQADTQTTQACLDVQPPFAVVGNCSEWQLKTAEMMITLV